MTAPSPNVAQPRAYWYAVSLAVLVVGLGLAAWQIKRSFLKEDGIARPVRGQGSIELDRSGSYSVYIHRGASQRMDASVVQAWAAARSANVTVHDERTGKPLAARNVYETIELQNNEMARLVEFQVPGPGTYRVAIAPSLEEVKPFVRPSVPVEKLGQELMGFVVGLLVGVGIGGGAALLAGAIFLTVLIRRRTFIKNSARAAVAGSTTY